MKCAVVVATMFQLFNTIKFANELKTQGYDIDLFFQNHSDHMSQILGEVEKLGFFENIYQWNDNYKNRNQVQIEFNRISRILFPRLRYRHMAIRPTILPPNDYYDLVTVTVATDMEIVLMNLNRKAKIIGYDDGTGSYVKNTFPITGRIWSLLNGNRIINNRNLEWLYLNNPEMCLYDPGCDIRKIPQLSELSDIYQNAVYRVFNYQLSNDVPRMVFLTFPYWERNLDEKQVNDINSIIYKHSKELIVRNHPREKRERVPGIRYDDSGILWELKCDNEITDDNILIAFCSTAQLTPKMLYDREPFLVFLYKLFDCDWIDGYVKLVEEIRMAYRDKTKIFIPDSLNDLDVLLKELL